MNDKEIIELKLMTELLKSMGDAKSAETKKAIKASEALLGQGENVRRLEALVR